MSDIPYIKPINIPEYKYKQSKYEMTPKLPFRSIVVASSTGGKTVLIQNLLLNSYRGSFERVYIFSPSIHSDPAFYEVKKYQKEVMKVDDTKEDLYFEGFNPSDLQKILERQKKVIEFQKNNKEKDLLSICIVIDDHSDDPKLLDILICYTVYLRGEDIKRSAAFYHYKSILLLLQLSALMRVLYTYLN